MSAKIITDNCMCWKNTERQIDKNLKCTNDTKLTSTPKRIKQLHQNESIEDYFNLGDPLPICAKEPSKSRALLLEAIELLTNEKRIIKVVHRDRKPAPYEEDAVWYKLCNRLLNLSPHNNVMKIYDIYESTEFFYFVLEKLDGEELFYRLSRKKLSEEECKNFMRQIIEGTLHLHRNKLLHRDIKPENVVFRNKRGEAPELVIVDFDTCLMMDSHPSVFDAIPKGKAILVGTPCYLAPELYRGAPPSVASDAWSIGATLYYLMTGRTIVEYSLLKNEKNKSIAWEVLQRRGLNFEFASFYCYPNARDLCIRLLHLDPQHRLSDLQQALHHPWLFNRECVQPSVQHKLFTSPSSSPQMAEPITLSPTPHLPVTYTNPVRVLLDATTHLNDKNESKRLRDMARMNVMDRQNHGRHVYNSMYRDTSNLQYMQHVQTPSTVMSPPINNNYVKNEYVKNKYDTNNLYALNNVKFTQQNGSCELLKSHHSCALNDEEPTNKINTSNNATNGCKPNGGFLQFIESNGCGDPHHSNQMETSKLSSVVYASNIQDTHFSGLKKRRNEVEMKNVEQLLSCQYTRMKRKHQVCRLSDVRLHN